MPKVYTGTSAGRKQSPLDYLKIGTGMVKDIAGLIQTSQALRNERKQIENERVENEYQRAWNAFMLEVNNRGLEGAVAENPSITKRLIEKAGFPDVEETYEDWKNNPPTAAAAIREARRQELSKGVVGAMEGMHRTMDEFRREQRQYRGTGEEVRTGETATAGKATVTTPDQKEPQKEASPHLTEESNEFRRRMVTRGSENLMSQRMSQEQREQEYDQWAKWKTSPVSERKPGTTLTPYQKSVESAYQEHVARPPRGEGPPPAEEEEEINFELEKIQLGGRVTAGGQWVFRVGEDRPQDATSQIKRVMEITGYKSKERFLRHLKSVNPDNEKIQKMTPENFAKQPWKTWMGTKDEEVSINLPGFPEGTVEGEVIKNLPEGKKKQTQETFTNAIKQLHKGNRKAAFLMGRKVFELNLSELSEYMRKFPDYRTRVLERAYGEDEWRRRIQRYPEGFLNNKELELQIEEFKANRELISAQMKAMGIDSLSKYFQIQAEYLKVMGGEDGQRDQLTAQAYNDVARFIRENPTVSLDNERQIARAMNNYPEFAEAYKYLAMRSLIGMGDEIKWKEVWTTWFPTVSKIFSWLAPGIVGKGVMVPTGKKMEGALPPGALTYGEAVEEMTRDNPAYARAMERLNQTLRQIDEARRQ